MFGSHNPDVYSAEFVLQYGLCIVIRVTQKSFIRLEEECATAKSLLPSTSCLRYIVRLLQGWNKGKSYHPPKNFAHKFGLVFDKFVQTQAM